MHACQELYSLPSLLNYQRNSVHARQHSTAPDIAAHAVKAQAAADQYDATRIQACPCISCIAAYCDNSIYQHRFLRALSPYASDPACILVALGSAGSTTWYACFMPHT